MRKPIIPNHRRTALQLTKQRANALAGWDSEGGSVRRRPPLRWRSELVPPAAPKLAGAELVQLRIRVIALENLVITLLAEGSPRQLDLAREMAAHVLPRPGYTHHRMTIHAAAQMLHLAKRARHFRVTTPAA
jgi:hypothetical protein